MGSNRYTTKQVCQALAVSRGIMTQAAELLGCTRETIWYYTKRYPTCQRALEQAREGFIDNAEGALQRRVDADDLQAVIFTLRTLGKHRGYTERKEFTGANGDVIRVLIVDENDEEYDVDA